MKRDGRTRVDIQAPRAPAGPLEVAHAELRRAQTALAIAERERNEARVAQQFADARVAFMERGAVEQQLQITALRTQLAEANELIRTLSAERFDEPTRRRDSSADIQAEIAAFEGQSTVVR